MSLDFFTFTRNSVATATLQDGTLSNVAVDVPVINFRDGAFAGYYSQIEATNLLLRSEEFDNAYWTKSSSGTGSNPSVTGNTVTAPDGTMTADSIMFDRGAGNTSSDRSILASSTLSITSGVTHAGSIWLKATSASDIGKQITVRHVRAIEYTVITLTGEWVRYEVIETPTSSGNRSFVLENRGGTSADNQVSCDLWGAQLETGAVATEYIKTTSASATRDEDVATITNVADKLGLTAGSVSITALFPTDYPLIVNGLQATVSGTKTIRFEYTTTTIELYVDNVLVDSATGTYDWSDLNEIQLGHYNGTDQPNFELRDLIVRKA